MNDLPPTATGHLSGALARGDLMAANCPSREVLRHMTSRWGVLVLIALENGTFRFSALRRRVGGVSERMLAQTLQWLEQDGLVRRVAHDVVPPHVDYSLTPLGREAALHVRALADWIEGAMPAIMQHWPETGPALDSAAPPQ
jgi:DNA-binding HxlR family transcriptional regulator